MQFKDIEIKPWEDGFALPEQFNMVNLLLERHIENGRGSRTAIYFKDDKLTYQQVYDSPTRRGMLFPSWGFRRAIVS